MIVILNAEATKENLAIASEDYENFIKITIDIEKEIVAIGGEYHFDAEHRLLKLGSNQKNIWGGGINLKTRQLTTNALINIRPKYNNSSEILNETARKKFINLAKKFLNVAFK